MLLLLNLFIIHLVNTIFWKADLAWVSSLIILFFLIKQNSFHSQLVQESHWIEIFSQLKSWVNRDWSIKSSPILISVSLLSRFKDLLYLLLQVIIVRLIDQHFCVLILFSEKVRVFYSCLFSLLHVLIDLDLTFVVVTITLVDRVETHEAVNTECNLLKTKEA